MATTICNVCGCKILDVQAVDCPRCDTPHHPDCWQYNGGCAVYACNPATRAVVVGKPGSPDPVEANARVLAPWIAGLAVLFALPALWFRMGPGRPRPLDTSPARPVAATTRAAPVPGAAPAPWVGHRAPDFTLPDLSGKRDSFGRIRNGRAALVTFWLAHCPDCMPWVPAWARIYERYQETDDLVLVNIAAFARDAAAIRAYCQEYGIKGRVLLDGDNEVVPVYRLGTITTFVIDHDGVIRYRESQPGTAADRVAPVVESVLAAKRASRTGGRPEAASGPFEPASGSRD
jgi:peroxiredoxin